MKIKNKSAPPCHPHQSYFSEVTTTIYSSGNCLCHSRLPAAVFLICHLSLNCWLSVLSDKQFISLCSSSLIYLIFWFLFGCFCDFNKLFSWSISFKQYLLTSTTLWKWPKLVLSFQFIYYCPLPPQLWVILLVYIINH